MFASIAASLALGHDVLRDAQADFAPAKGIGADLRQPKSPVTSSAFPTDELEPTYPVTGDGNTVAARAGRSASSAQLAATLASLSRCRGLGSPLFSTRKQRPMPGTRAGANPWRSVLPQPDVMGHAGVKGA